MIVSVTTFVLLTRMTDDFNFYLSVLHLLVLECFADNNTCVGSRPTPCVLVIVVLVVVVVLVGHGA